MYFPSVAGRIRVNVPDHGTLKKSVTERLRSGNGFAVATINLDHLVKLKEDRGFADAYLAQDLVVVDGNPLVWMSHIAKQPVDLMPGSDLVVPLARLAADLEMPIGLIGSTEDALGKAEQALRDTIPALKVACKIAPPMGFDPESPAAEALIQDAEKSGARLCFLALGAPKQELLAARGRSIAPSLGFVSIGAGLDFLAGSQTRAPVWMRKMALEWVWRLIQNPRRLGPRYAQCLAILPTLTTDAFKQRNTQS